MLTLKHADGRTVKEGDAAKTFRGERVTITGWKQPYHYGSTGRVYVEFEGSPGTTGEFYPSVCGLHWEKS